MRRTIIRIVLTPTSYRKVRLIQNGGLHKTIAGDVRLYPGDNPPIKTVPADSLAPVVAS